MYIHCAYKFSGWAGLVLVVDLFGSNDGEADEVGVVEVGLVHVDGGNLVIVVGSVVADALFEVVAGRVDSDFVLIVTEVATATLLVDGMENVEELADTRELIVW